MQARHLVGLGQLEAEALGVVVDELDLGQLQGDEALIKASESFLRLSTDRLLNLRLGLLHRGRSTEVPVAGAGQTGRASREQQCVGTALGAGLGSIAADVLQTS